MCVWDDKAKMCVRANKALRAWESQGQQIRREKERGNGLNIFEAMAATLKCYESRVRKALSSRSREREEST